MSFEDNVKHINITLFINKWGHARPHFNLSLNQRSFYLEDHFLRVLDKVII